MMTSLDLPTPTNTGLSPAELAQGRADLEIILKAIEAQPDQKFAVTGLADTVLHSLLDMPELAQYMCDTFGPDAIAHHDPEAWGTDEYAVAWANTRRAFAAHGIELEADAAATRAHGGRTDGRQAELCFMSIGRTDGRHAELCFFAVGKAN